MSIVNVRTDTTIRRGLTLATDAGVKVSGIRENTAGGMTRRLNWTRCAHMKIARSPSFRERRTAASTKIG